MCRVVGFCSKGPPWVQRRLPGAPPRGQIQGPLLCSCRLPPDGTRDRNTAGSLCRGSRASLWSSARPEAAGPSLVCVCVRARLPATLRSPVKHDPAFSSGTSCLTLAQRRQLPSSKGFVVNLGDSEAPLASSLVSSELSSVAGSSPLQVGLSCDRFPSSLLQP